MKTYDIVKSILLRDPEARNSDKHLMFRVWEYQGYDITNYGVWMEKAAHPKSIIESRRNLQRDQEEIIKTGGTIPPEELLIADEEVIKLRSKLDEQKGTHIFREDVPALPKEPILKKKKWICPSCKSELKKEIETVEGSTPNSLRMITHMTCTNDACGYEYSR